PTLPLSIRSMACRFASPLQTRLTVNIWPYGAQALHAKTILDLIRLGHTTGFFLGQRLNRRFNIRFQFIITLSRHATAIDEYCWRRFDAQLHTLFDITLHHLCELSRVQSAVKAGAIESEFTCIHLQLVQAQRRL